MQAGGKMWGCTVWRKLRLKMCARTMSATRPLHATRALNGVVWEEMVLTGRQAYVLASRVSRGREHLQDAT